jgi:hypothetical protein
LTPEIRRNFGPKPRLRDEGEKHQFRPEMSSSSGSEDADWQPDVPRNLTALKAPQPIPQAFRNMFGKAVLEDGSRFVKKRGTKPKAKKVTSRGGSMSWRGLDSGSIIEGARRGSLK